MFNYDYLEVSSLIIKQADSIDFWLIGAGGTNTWLSYHIARLARSLGKSGKKVELALADPDIVEVTYFDLESGTARSIYITQQSVCAGVKFIAK